MLNVLIREATNQAVDIVHDSTKALDNLMAYATEAVHDLLAKKGYVLPTIFLESGDAIIRYAPELKRINECSDHLADVARELACVYMATAVVVAGQVSREGSHPGILEYALEATDNSVALIGASRFERENRVLPIRQFSSGRFAGFDKPVVFRNGQIHGDDPTLMLYGIDEEARRIFEKSLRENGHPLEHVPQFERGIGRGIQWEGSST